jgi:hypothetical protein
MTPCLDFLLDLSHDLDLVIVGGWVPGGRGAKWLRIELPTHAVEWSGATMEAAAQRVIEIEFPYLADVLSPPLEA